MLPILARRTLSIALALCCIIFIVISALAYLYSINDTGPLSLADRVDENVTVFIKANDRTTLESLLQKYAPFSPVNIAALPEGTHYEFALLETGSGSIWAIDSANEEPNERITLTSSGQLPPILPSASLAKINAVKKYTENNNNAWLYAQSHTLKTQQKSIVDELSNALLASIKNVLIVWENDKSGLLLLQGAHPRPSVASASSSIDLSPAPLLQIDMNDPSSFIEILQRRMSANTPATAEGIAGILTHALKPFIGNMTLEEAQKTLLNGDASFFLGTEENELAIGLVGSTRQTRDIHTWIYAINATKSDVRIRTIVFPKKENIRQDVISEKNVGLMQLPDLHGWERSIIGSGTLVPLYVAVQGNHYAISNNDVFLQKLLTAPTTQKTGTMRGTVDGPWLKNWLGTIGASFASSAKRINWNVVPRDEGWLIHWEMNKEAPSPASSSLAK